MVIHLIDARKPAGRCAQTVCLAIAILAGLYALWSAYLFMAVSDAANVGDIARQLLAAALRSTISILVAIAAAMAAAFFSPTWRRKTNPHR